MFVLTEKIPIEKALFLYDMKFADFKQYLKRCKNDAERMEQFNKTRKFCKEVIDGLGVVERKYEYSSNMRTSGRLFSVAGGVQGIMREIRGFLLSHTTDIDMKNAHPVITKYLCKTHNIPCPNLEYYINNRDKILSEFPDKNIGKEAFLKSLNNDKINKNIANSHFRKFDCEIKKIQKSLIELPEYVDIVNSIPEKKDYNITGSKLNRILCHFENEILQVAVEYLRSANYECASFMFDGCNVYDNLYNNTDLLKILTEECNKKFNGLDMVWDYKQHEKVINMPDNFKPNILGVKEIKKTQDPDAKNLITSNLRKYMPIEFLSRTEGTIKFIEKYEPNKFIWVRGLLYCWTGYKWEQKSHEFTKYIMRDACDILDSILEKANAELNQFLEVERTALNKINDEVNEAKFHFKDNNYTCNVIKASSAFFTREDIEFDNNDNLLGFNNGVYDLVEHKFRPYKYDDYMTMTCGYDYNSNINPSKRKEVELLLEKIMPNPENRSLLLQIFSAGLTGRCIEKFIMLNGGGRNGKGLLNEFMMLILGDYQFIYANVSLLTDAKKSGPNPELASINKKRYIALKEPDSGLTLHNDCVKDITGGGNVSARMCYSNETLVRLKNITVLECNDRPKFNSEPTNAEFERLVDLEFPNRFTSLPAEVDNITVFMGDSKYKTEEWKLEHRDDFLQILLEYFKILQNNNYVFSIPVAVQQRSNEYLNGSFPILEIFYENYEKTGVNTDIVKLKDICEVIKSSDSYYNFDKKQKRKYNNKYICNFIEKQRDLRKSYKDRVKINYTDCFSVLLGYKRINQHEYLGVSIDETDEEIVEE